MKKIQILLVEDSPLAAKMGVMLLSGLAYEVTHVISGEEAVEKFKPNHFDIIFMDLGLPGMDGFKTTETIRKIERQDNRIAIIALTAHTDDEYRQKASAAGMDYFLSKPLTANTAQEIIVRYVNRHRSPQPV